MLPDLMEVVPRWPDVGAGRRVIVIGGGISGLCAAWGLREAGFAPLVLERTPRVGGRFWTNRDHFQDQYAELGVTRFPETHHLTLNYIRHFGLPLIEFPFDGARQLYSVMGKRFKSYSQGRADYPDDLPLSPEERELDAEQIDLFYTAKAASQIGDPRDAKWPPAHVREEMAGQTLYQYLDRIGASQAAKEICLAYDGSEFDVYDALGWLAIQQLDINWLRSSYAIEGGNDKLTSAFGASLGDLVVTNAHVKRVTSDESHVSVAYVRGGQVETVEGDFAVCAVPHRILLDIDFDPPLSDGKRRAAAEVPMFRVTRLNYQFSRRFWNLDEDLRGLIVACTSTPIERLWDLTNVQPGSRGILAAYVQHHNAEVLDEMPTDDARLEYGLRVMESFLPGARQHVLKGLSFSWQQPWTKGAWPIFLPNQLGAIADFQRAEGRVSFAGDHTCLYTAWAQGALESAHFAIAEVIAACRTPAQGAP